MSLPSPPKMPPVNCNPRRSGCCCGGWSGTALPAQVVVAQAAFDVVLAVAGEDDSLPVAGEDHVAAAAGAQEMRSLPPMPSISSAWAVPTITSLPGVPVTPGTVRSLPRRSGASLPPRVALALEDRARSCCNRVRSPLSSSVQKSSPYGPVVRVVAVIVEESVVTRAAADHVVAVAADEPRRTLPCLRSRRRRLGRGCGRCRDQHPRSRAGRPRRSVRSPSPPSMSSWPPRPQILSTAALAVDLIVKVGADEMSSPDVPITPLTVALCWLQRGPGLLPQGVRRVSDKDCAKRGQAER